VFTLLKHDLKDELAKELFVHYHGSASLLPYFKPTSKVSYACLVAKAAHVLESCPNPIIKHNPDQTMSLVSQLITVEGYKTRVMV